MKPILCLVTNREVSRIPLAEAVEVAVANGVDRVQIRERGLEDTALLKLTEAICDAARRGAKERDGCVELWMNRRVDLALVLGLDGIHLGRGAISPRDARALLGPTVKISRSAHAVEDITEAVTQGADVAQLAPIFPPLSKRIQNAPMGCETLRRATTAPIPVLAQGGITPQNCREVLAAGAAGVAVTGAILQQSDPGAAAQTFRHSLDRVAKPNLS